MINFNGLRGSGKTFNLVKEANKAFMEGNEVVILAPNISYKHVFDKYKLHPQINVISYKEYKKDWDKYSQYKVFIDELEYFIQSELLIKNLYAFTTEKENVKDVKKKWLG